MRQAFALAFALTVVAPTPGSAQAPPRVQGPLAPTVERGYEPGVGRGLLYGAHLISPIYVLPLERGGGGREPLGVGGGGGVHARLGWELPNGLSVELYGGIAFNGLDAVAGEDPARSHVLTQTDVNLGLRYAFINETPLVPFVQLAGGARFLGYTWASATEPTLAAAPTVSAAVGAQLELAPFFAIEVGATMDYTFGLDAFDAGFLSITPFLGVTLYWYDENE